ncbi:tankyrase 2 [Dunaliella salina]|uniref:Tankyrase 2 n=1 Tax=Dunaliella salina TaxID=3046 RepID=A0ABQ7GGR4_DUNSA|nr:tankyrase 2 [Dunaliella salina]|eukprot:KAF5833799.1 tankyrase 2 [Dunaliella salina]
MGEDAEEELTLDEQLIDSARYDEIEDVQAALSGGANVDAADEQGRTALHMASANGHLEIVRRLLSAGADAESKNAGSNTPLHFACLNGHLEVARALLEAGAKASVVNSAGRTPIDEALDKSAEDLVALIDEHSGTSTTDQGELIDAGDDAVEEKEGEGEGGDGEHRAEQEEKSG